MSGVRFVPVAGSFDTLRAWLRDGGQTASVEVPVDRSAACRVIADQPLAAGVRSELARAARLITETPGGVWAATESGWVVSR